MKESPLVSFLVIVIVFLGFAFILTREWFAAALTYCLGFVIQSWRLP